MMNVSSFKSKFGWITVTEQNKKIISVRFGKYRNIGTSSELKEVKKNILNYFSKKSEIITKNILMSGSGLQIKIWKQISKIPYGQTSTYSAIANKLKTSPRYVGNVCGLNKHLLLIPCHRVLRKDGKLGGFSGLGGLKLKQKLLQLEM
jgi:methylated-DNA-[protein]-cysteine S-methyltransferase